MPVDRETRASGNFIGGKYRDTSRFRAQREAWVGSASWRRKREGLSVKLDKPVYQIKLCSPNC